jgi:Flp pilus assembly secretin CpaC
MARALQVRIRRSLRRKPLRHTSSCACLAALCFGIGFTGCLFAQQPTSESDPNAAAAISGSANAGKQDAHKKDRVKDTRAAEDAFISGARLLEKSDRAGAEREFARAAQLAPDNRDYTLALSAIRQSRISELVHQAGAARLLGRNAEAESLLAQARRIDPQSPILLQHPVPSSISSDPEKVHSWLLDGPRLAVPIALKPTAGVKSFHIRSTLQEAVRQVAAAYGLKASLDSTVPNTQVKFDLDNVVYAQAMHVLMDMGPLFTVALTPEMVFIAKDTEENRQRYERQVQETIYAAGMTNDQLAELGNMIKNVFEVKQVSVANSFGTLVVRAPEETIRVLNLTLADMLDGGSEVMLDLKLYSVDKARTLNLGALLPSQGGAYNVASAANALVQANQSVVNQAIAQGIIPAGTSNLEIAALLLEYGLATSSLLSNTLAFVGGGITTTGVYSNASSTLNIALNSSDTRALDDIQLRVGDRQSATFRAGSKYPITQSTYSTTTAASAAGLAGATIGGVSVASLLNQATTATTPQIQYEDLGVTLKATPTVQKSGLISMHLDLKIEALQGGTVDNIPILTNTAYTSDITVGDGQTAFLVSNLTKSQIAAVTGVPGLSELPGFQQAPELDKTTDAAQLLMVLTPRLVRKRANDSAGPRFPIATPATASAD